MTHREARAKLGSRTTRRAGTNGKNIPGKTTSKGRAYKRRFPKKASRKVALKVRALLKAASTGEVA